ncbi:murein hydrolase activator EnvC family protein [Phaeovulum vinaykumarii]|uniref:Septal ring factor EnvC, activator of murein hydrolases AmiA and AmiB n=1 Tax=Phaeovulum vinaykumarii TaxID=407234 RepID=A0A1N7KQZ3_9RHOB|nr:peptidoglycan DD-metalloendopeptidase family protein [Phaeovulum vinaykumarii]SIS64019.1 Septal ring factor EnvC, activator of murein hydrolases AmiA and AmiB [Phaeovulum vinaykumarii]SOC01698.1 septal ring factor EnvC (AmiA/AmiB activator) [Phaeovulum vinaykumarii]
MIRASRPLLALGLAAGLAAGMGAGFGAGMARAEDAATVARAAADGLHAAIADLDRARSAADRVAALTRTIHAYEQGLAALRDGLRRAAIREAEIAARLDTRREEIGRLLGVMATMHRSEGPLLLLHPAGALGSARSGMLLSAITPALQAEAEDLRADLTEVARLRALQDAAAGTLAEGLGSVQAARTALSEAVAERRDLPRRYLEDPEELRELVASADTLEGFATGLAGLENDIGPPMADFAAAKGQLPLPVMGRLIRRAGEADAAGIRRPGIVLAAAAGALVTTPWPATIRYRGPLLDYGNVMVLEPARGYLLVLAGLGTVFGATGDVLKPGDPVGLMGGAEPQAQEFGAAFVSEARQGGGAQLGETLYIELRVDKTPVDPAEWFAETRNNQR